MHSNNAYAHTPCFPLLLVLPLLLPVGARFFDFAPSLSGVAPFARLSCARRASRSASSGHSKQEQEQEREGRLQSSECGEEECVRQHQQLGVTLLMHACN